MGSTTIVEALREANEDKQVVAIVLRIDSPGGSALASDLIWHETQVIEKPIVASMGDVAASGGYYIAMGADKIIAAPGTITGSIGVVGGKMAIRGLVRKARHHDRNDRARQEQRPVLLQRQVHRFAARRRERDDGRHLRAIHRRRPRKGRKMPVEKLRELAGGRVYTGRQAKENGLVDELGTLDDAIAEAKKLAGLEEDADVRIEVLPEPTNFFESLFGDLDAEKEVRIGKGLERMSPGTDRTSPARRTACARFSTSRRRW